VVFILLVVGGHATSHCATSHCSDHDSPVSLLQTQTLQASISSLHPQGEAPGGAQAASWQAERRQLPRNARSFQAASRQEANLEMKHSNKDQMSQKQHLKKQANKQAKRHAAHRQLGLSLPAGSFQAARQEANLEMASSNEGQISQQQKAKQQAKSQAKKQSRKKADRWIRKHERGKDERKRLKRRADRWQAVKLARNSDGTATKSSYTSLGNAVCSGHGGASSAILGQIDGVTDLNACQSGCDNKAGCNSVAIGYEGGTQYCHFYSSTTLGSGYREYSCYTKAA